MPEKQEKLNQESSTPTTAGKKTKKQLEVRTVPGYGMFEVKFQGGGEQPKEFKGQRWTSKALAKRALADYLKGK